MIKILSQAIFFLSLAFLLSINSPNAKSLCKPFALKNFDADRSSYTSTQAYLSCLQQRNKISYHKIINTVGSYIPSMCYTQTLLENGRQQNPCYACHIQGIEPNYINDSDLQQQLNFPAEMVTNPYTNLFAEHSEKVTQISDSQILNYVRQSNYQNNGKIILASELPPDWKGYKPDAFYNFDNEGFDHTPDGDFTLWRAYRYYPFPGTFWPTNGSTDDVMIRLTSAFSENTESKFDLEVYTINLAIVESLIKSEDVQLNIFIDEKLYAEDLNKNGKMDISKTVVFPPKHYVGRAKILQKKGRLHLAAGLFPENTEFLHSVRYLDWDTKLDQVKLSARMKELRYARKYQWLNYSQLKDIDQREYLDLQVSNDSKPKIEIFRGTPEQGLRTNNGWIFQGFIEAKNGLLRPQTREETAYCMGCHSEIGATTDATFSFSRKFSEKEIADSWQHWSQKDMVGIKEPIVSYKNNPNIFEYSFYLQNNNSGNELSNNDEIKNKFFDVQGDPIEEQWQALHKDISTLLFPSYKRALKLNKGYKVIVDEQSYIYGREGNISPLKYIHKKIKPNQTTRLNKIIIR